MVSDLVDFYVFWHSCQKIPVNAVHTFTSILPLWNLASWDNTQMADEYMIYIRTCIQFTWIDAVCGSIDLWFGSSGIPNFAEVYSFIGSVFDPNGKDHMQKLKEMDPISFETVSLLSLDVDLFLLEKAWKLSHSFLFWLHICLPTFLQWKRIWHDLKRVHPNGHGNKDALVEQFMLTIALPCGKKTFSFTNPFH